MRLLASGLMLHAASGCHGAPAGFGVLDAPPYGNRLKTLKRVLRDVANTMREVD